MMDQTRVEPARAEDLEWCARLMSSNDPWITLGRTFEDCLAAVTNPEYVNLVAWRGGERAGCIRIHPRGVAGSPYIASVVVAEQWRGQGIGTDLVDCAERMHRGKARFIFLCVSSFNPRARALYERHGYALVAELKDYVRDGLSEMLMHKRLA
jgi:[ribosomal protein S18]-alanine N-acetyltransferase